MLSSLLGLCLLLPVLMRFAAPLCIFVLLRLKGRTKEVEMITEEIHLLKQEQSQVRHYFYVFRLPDYQIYVCIHTLGGS